MFSRQLRLAVFTFKLQQNKASPHIDENSLLLQRQNFVFVWIQNVFNKCYVRIVGRSEFLIQNMFENDIFFFDICFSFFFEKKHKKV